MARRVSPKKRRKKKKSSGSSVRLRITIAMNCTISPSSYLFATWSTETILSTETSVLVYYTQDSPILFLPQFTDSRCSIFLVSLRPKRTIKQENLRCFSLDLTEKTTPISDATGRLQLCSILSIPSLPEPKP